MFGDDGSNGWECTSKLSDDVKKLVKALREVKRTIVAASEQKGGPVNDTIWYSDTETLCDFIDRHTEEY